MYFYASTLDECAPFDSIKPIEKPNGEYVMVRGRDYEWEAWDKLTNVYGKDPVWITELMEKDENANGMAFQKHFWIMVEYILGEYDKTFEDFDD